MACKIHNVKFYKPKPSGINCMVYNTIDNKLALSRSDATIEIWNLSHCPFIERTIVNRTGASIEALCWFETRLFSVGLTGELIEYDLRQLTEKHSTLITGVAGWCMDVHLKTSKLIVGTEQGYLNLYSVLNEGVEYDKLLDKQEGRVLCLKFDVTGNFIASGSINTVRVWNVNSGHAIHKMNLSQISANVETVVWCLAITEDFTVISGDSRGCLTFWDGELGAQIESYKTHCSAILSLCLSEDQKSVYCAGVDPIILNYVKINVKGDKHKWVRSIQRKIHVHDVRCLLFVDNKLYSAGVDGYLACSSYPPKTLVKYPPLLQSPNISIARKARLLLLRYYNYLELWELGKESESDDDEMGLLQLVQEPKKLLLLQTKGEETIVCSDVSSDGKWLCYSTRTKLRVFNIDYSSENLQILSCNLPEYCVSSFRVAFNPNNEQLVLAGINGGLQIVEINENQLILSQNIGTNTYLKDVITFLIFSPCGKYLITADPESNIVCWQYTESWKYKCTLPRYNAIPTALNVQPNNKNLIVVYANHKIVEFDLERERFTNFSRDLDERTPKQWLNRSVPVNNVTFDPKADNILLFHDDSTIWVIDKNKKLSKTDAKVPKIDGSNSSHDSVRASKHAFHIVKKQKHLVYFDWIDESEMVSVEVSPLSLAETLPPCFETKKFGRK